MKKKDVRLSGIDPLAYTGVFAESPQGVTSNTRDPGVTDKKGFTEGDLWINRSSEETWYLSSLDGGSASWIKFGTPSETVITFDTDSGSATQSAGVLNLPGGDLIDTSGSGNTVTVVLTNGTNGQVIIGGTSPAWANITSTGASITITNGANSINLESAGGVTSLTQIDGDGGSALPVAGEIIVAGGTNLNTSASGSTLTVNLDDDPTLAGTLTLGALGAGVMQTNGSGVVTSSNGTNGQVLVGGGSAPAWANITSTGATVTVTNGANTINIEATGGGGGVGTSGFFACQESNGGIPSAGWLYPDSRAAYYLGESVILTEVFDNGGDLYPGDGAGTRATFTAPVDGKYFFGLRGVVYRATSVIPPSIFVNAVIETSNRVYASVNTFDVGYASASVDIKKSLSYSTYADMDAGDTAEFGLCALYPRAKWFTVHGAAVTAPITWICGYLAA